MIGFNGGLIGEDRTPSLAAAVGVWTLDEQIKARRSNLWPVPGDPDVDPYIAAVEAADGQALEAAVKVAINVFVLGCKTDGTWNAIKASCILAGARTLAGALVPLKGTAPTNVSSLFVSGDYNRETGLLGNGTTKYLDSNRNNNTDPQNSSHNAVYVSTAATNSTAIAPAAYMGADDATNSTGTNIFGTFGSNIFFRNRNGSASLTGTNSATGLIGHSRAGSADYTTRVSGVSATQSVVSETPFNGNLRVFATGAGSFPSNGRLAFYSIGESLDLALLDTRVTTLIADIAAAIP